MNVCQRYINEREREGGREREREQQCQHDFNYLVRPLTPAEIISVCASALFIGNDTMVPSNAVMFLFLLIQNFLESVEEIKITLLLIIGHFSGSTAVIVQCYNITYVI